MRDRWRGPAGRLFPLGFFQLPIDPKLDAPDGKQVEFGFGLARNDFVVDAELPFPDSRSDSRDGVFNALVSHIKIPLRPQTASNPNLILKIVSIIQYNYKLCSHVRLARRLDTGEGSGEGPGIVRANPNPDVSCASSKSRSSA